MTSLRRLAAGQPPERSTDDPSPLPAAGRVGVLSPAWALAEARRGMRRRYPTGGYAYCSRCERRVPCRLPRARFHPGDGSVVLPFAHRDSGGERCDGRFAPALTERELRRASAWPAGMPKPPPYPADDEGRATPDA